MSGPYALEVHNLSVNYDRTPVLWDISFQIPPGSLTAIIGPNGAGKSTLIKTLLGLVTPIAGKISFWGENLRRVRQRIAYVPQRESVDWHFPITVRELVLMGRYGQLGLCRWPRKADRSAAEHYLEMVEMLPFADRQISELSGGQQQRVFFARSLMQNADMYFLDEPLAGIDHASEKVIMELLKEQQKEGKTLFVVHHDLSNVEEYFDWAILLNMRMIGYGPLDQVYTADMLAKTYGKSYALFDEALRLSQKQLSGRVTR